MCYYNLKLLYGCKGPYTSPYTANLFVIHDWYIVKYEEVMCSTKFVSSPTQVYLQCTHK